MAVPLRRFWPILIFLLLQSNKSLSISCYYCNTRDHPICNELRPGEQKYLMKCPTQSTCTIMKGQYEFNRNRKLLLWRGCNKIDMCAHDRSLCCHCGNTGCNYENTCYRHPAFGMASKNKDGIQLIPLCIIFNVIVHILS